MLILLSSLAAWEISHEDAEIIGKHIFANECSSKMEKLVWWNDGEQFASLGIGHFIWYPADQKGPFEETFPSFLALLKTSGLPIPLWLKNISACPWRTKEEYLDPKQEPKKKDLQALLLNSIPLQTSFIVKRFEQTLPDLLATVSESKKKIIVSHIERLSKILQGKYALLDYHNFKGKGMSESERYQGQGWGLKQVLENMPDNPDDPLLAFMQSAKALLEQRVKNAPPERHEERWLPGWLNRIDSYSKI